MVLNKGIWDPKPRVTNIKGTNLKSLTIKKTLSPVSPYIPAEVGCANPHFEGLATERDQNASANVYALYDATPLGLRVSGFRV